MLWPDIGVGLLIAAALGACVPDSSGKNSSSSVIRRSQPFHVL